MTEPNPVEVAARVRAAEAYAGFKHGQLGAAIGLNEATVRRLVSPTNPRTASMEERHKIAEACGLPYAFFEVDFSTLGQANGTSEVERRLAAIEETLREDVLPVLPSAAEDEVPDPRPATPAPVAQPRPDTAGTASRARRQQRRGR